MSVTVMMEGAPDLDAQTLEVAMALAGRLRTHVTAKLAQPDPASVVLYVATPEACGLTATTMSSLQSAQESVRSDAKDTVARAQAAAPDDVKVELDVEAETPFRAAVNAATLSDAIVFNRRCASPVDALSDVFEHVLMTARLPVVLAGKEIPPEGPMVVAWDGSDTAARAVRLHLPLLKAAGKVLIAQNAADLKKDHPRTASDPERLVKWLARHGIRTEVTPFDGGVAEGLQSLATGAGAMGIVAGAYGHSRLGERLFGGTTRALLKQESGPLLALAH